LLRIITIGDPHVFLKLLQEWKGQPAGATVDVPEEYAPLLTEPRIAEAVKDQSVDTLIKQSLDAATAKWASRMDQVFNLALQKVQEAQGQAKRHAVPAIFGPCGKGDPRHSFGDWLLAVRRNDAR
jgi:hypothetical protein